MVDVTGKAADPAGSPRPGARSAPRPMSPRLLADPGGRLAIDGGGRVRRHHGGQADVVPRPPVPSDPPRRRGRRDPSGVRDGFRITAEAAITDRTGVEMEALTACTAAALVLLQPLLDARSLTSIEELTLWRKTGGRSGTWERAEDGEMRAPDESCASQGRV